MSRTLLVTLTIALAGAGTLIAASASGADNERTYTRRISYCAYAPTPWRGDMRDYHFSRDNGGYEQEYKVGNCQVKRELEEDGDFNEEVHCEAHPD